MKPKSNRALSLKTVGLIVAVLLLIAACAPSPTAAPGATTVSTTVPAATTAPTAAPAATAAPATAPAAPKVGGTLVWAVSNLVYDGLDPQSAGGRTNNPLISNLGSGLVTRDLKTGAVVPFLAESWKVSDDGLTYEFKLKKNIKWHDGTPFTAKDYIYTIQRHKDPALKSPTAVRTWGAVASAEAPDDYTLILKLSKPDATFFSNLALTWSQNQPLPKQATEKLGTDFGIRPVLSGPFKYKESQTGVKTVFERNPDFNWGPAGYSGPAYIQNLEYRQVKEYATILAGLESGEIDIAEVQAKDIDRLTATGKVRVEQLYAFGLNPTVAINASRAPWDDSRVRKAVNLALDRQAMIKVVKMVGRTEEQRGPVAKGSLGYWSGVEQIGYGFDLNQAKTLMKEAGYTLGSDGILVKDGKPLKFTLKAWAQEPYTTLAQVIKEQLKALGIDLDIQTGPSADITAEMASGKYDLGVVNINGQPNGVALLYESFHSKSSSTLNLNQVKDPQLDDLVLAMVTATSDVKTLELAAAAQKLIVEKAYSVPLYTGTRFLAVSNRIKGLVSNEYTFIFPNLINAYIEGGK